jgi:pimeloyl-ACP methyl ester carboxylesterase
VRARPTVEDATVEIGGSRLAVRRVCSNAPARAQPIVLLHEALGCIDLWKGFPERLADVTGREVIAYDRVGHGRSSPLLTTRGIDYLHRLALDELPEVLASCGVSRPVLYGHSDGATIAALYAAHRPATAVVAESIHVLVEPETVTGVNLSGDERDRRVERLRRYHGAKAPGLMAAWADTWTADWFRCWNVVDELGTIDCPVLAIQGLDDHYGTVRQLEELRRGMSAPVRELVLSGCGHWPHRDASEATLEAVRGFLREVA